MTPRPRARSSAAWGLPSPSGLNRARMAAVAPGACAASHGARHLSTARRAPPGGDDDGHALGRASLSARTGLPLSRSAPGPDAAALPNALGDLERDLAAERDAQRLHGFQEEAPRRPALAARRRLARVRRSRGCS